MIGKCEYFSYTIDFYVFICLIAIRLGAIKNHNTYTFTFEKLVFHGFGFPLLKGAKTRIKGILTSSKRQALYVGFISFSQMVLVYWRIFAGSIWFQILYASTSKYPLGHQRHLGEANKTYI